MMRRLPGGTGSGQFDYVFVDGVSHFGGTLRVKLVNLGGGTYVPQLGDGVPFMSSAGTGGSFAVLDLPPLAAGLEWAILPGNVATFLAVVPEWAGNSADFNRAGYVNNGDLFRWQANYGATGQTDNKQGDADADGDVDGGDYLTWQQQLGSGPQAAAVPEPASLRILTAAGALSVSRIRFAGVR